MAVVILCAGAVFPSSEQQAASSSQTASVWAPWANRSSALSTGSCRMHQYLIAGALCSCQSQLVFIMTPQPGHTAVLERRRGLVLALFQASITDEAQLAHFNAGGEAPPVPQLTQHLPFESVAATRHSGSSDAPGFLFQCAQLQEENACLGKKYALPMRVIGHLR